MNHQRRATLQTESNGVPLNVGQFRKIAGNGFGDGANSYAYCYAWYYDHLYIGTNRNILALIRRRFTFDVPFAVWPVKVPEVINPNDQCAEIWRYHPPTGIWDRVYRSPITDGIKGHPVPLAAGFRNMAVFQGRSDPRPCIYTIPSCGSFGIGPVLIRSADGENFEAVSEPGMGIADTNVTSFRGVIAFKGMLFVTPAGSRGFNPNVSYNSTILCSDDPVNGQWQPSCTPCFGDVANVSIHDMAVFDDHLYAGTMNIQRGYELWRTDAQGPPPHRWEKVLDGGAGRGIFNQAVVSMAAFGDHLYVGGGVQNGGCDRVNKIGPASAEIIRVRTDGQWDLVAGETRMTSTGLKVPTSGMGPGFDSPFTGYIWRMCEHDGVLYVGTFESSSFLPFAKLEENFGFAMDEASIEHFTQLRGGTKLWRSRDGDKWVPVTLNGFGNPYNFGIRTLQSSPYGLFVGTANPFGSEVAVRYPSGFRYEHNPHGGIEVWHGRPEHSISADTVDSEPRDKAEQLWGMSDHSGANTYAHTAHEHPTGQLLAAGGDGDGDEQALHRITDLQITQQFAELLDPTLALAEAGEFAKTPEHDDSEVDAYFGSDIHNAGLWSGVASESPRLASVALIKELVEMLELDPTDLSYSVLTIADGLAGVGREVLNLRTDVQLTGLCFDRVMARKLRKQKPPIKILYSKPHRFSVKANTFDAVIWIEGPNQHDRQQGLREAFRVLRPGGRLVAVDLVDDSMDSSSKSALHEINHVAAATDDLNNSGFDNCSVVDITRKGWVRFLQHSRQYYGTKFLMQQIDADRYQAILASLPGNSKTIAAHLIFSASKREDTR